MSDVNGIEFARHATWLRRLARGLAGGDETVADDALQDTWMAAFARSPDRSYVRPWLVAVLRNLISQHHRSEGRRQRREHEASSPAASPVETAEDLLLRHEVQRKLSHLVGDLEEPYRSTILLRYSEGLTPSQIATRLGIPPGTVRWRLKTALDRLRTEIDRGGPGRSSLRLLIPMATPDLVSRMKESIMAVVSKKAVIAVVGLSVALGTAWWTYRTKQPERSLGAGTINGGVDAPMTVVGSVPTDRTRDRASSDAPSAARKPPRFVVAPEPAAPLTLATEDSLRQQAVNLRDTWSGCAAGSEPVPDCAVYRQSLATLALSAHKRSQQDPSTSFRELALEFYEDFFRAAPPTEPRLYEMTFYAAELYWLLERWPEAEAQYNRVLLLEPGGMFGKDAKYARDLAAKNARDHASKNTGLAPL